LKALLPKFLEHRRKRAVDFNLDGVGSIASDLADYLRRAARDHAVDARAAGETHDAREVDVAAHRRTSDDQFARTLEGRERLVTFVNELVHSGIVDKPARSRKPRFDAAPGPALQ
jgi:hypothetical protein